MPAELYPLNIPEGRFVSKDCAALAFRAVAGHLSKLQVVSISERHERYNELLKIQGISQQEYDLTELQVSNLKADIQLIQVDINRAQIRAPFSGQIGLKTISEGAYVTPANIITTISQVSDLKIEFTVPEKYSESMTKGKRFSSEWTGSQFQRYVMATESMIGPIREAEVRGS